MSTGALITATQSEAQDILVATAPEFIAGRTNETIRKNVVLAFMRRDGVITTGHAGTMVIYQIEYKQPEVLTYSDRSQIQYDPQDNTLQAALNWGGYVCSMSMHLKSQMMNSGGLALFDKTMEDIESCINSVSDRLSRDVYTDPGTDGNALNGFESFLTFTTPASTDLVATPNDTYAGLATNLADKGGSWSTDISSPPNSTLATDWPHGTGTTEYAYNSPVGINWSASTWGTGAQTWEANSERALSQAYIWLRKNGGMAGEPNLTVMDSSLYWGYLNSQRSKQRIVIPHKKSQDLGFDMSVNQEGVAIHMDYACPANTAYVMNTENMELRALGDTLIGQYGPHDHPADASKLWSFFSFPQMVFRPRHVAKIKNFA